MYMLNSSDRLVNINTGELVITVSTNFKKISVCDINNKNVHILLDFEGNLHKIAKNNTTEILKITDYLIADIIVYSNGYIYIVDNNNMLILYRLFGHILLQS